MIDLPDKQSGGAYVFQSSVIEAFIARAKLQNISITLLSKNKTKFTKYKYELKVYYLLKSYLNILNLGKIILSGMISMSLDSLKLKYIKDELIKKYLDKIGVDYIVNLQQETICYSKPFLIVNWDIEHIKKPWMPEFQNGNEWHIREEKFNRNFKRAHAIVTGSELGKHDIQKYYSIDGEKIHVIEMPTNYRFQKKQKIQNFNYCISSLIYPAQFWPHKNHSTIILAIEILINKGVKLPEVIFFGSDKGNLKYIENELKKLGLERQIKIKGFTERENLEHYLRNNSMMLYPSIFGPDNIPPLEGLSHDCWVVVSDTNGHRQQLGKYVEYAATFNPKSWADAIEEILNRSKAPSEYYKDLPQEIEKRSVENYAEKIIGVIVPIKETLKLYQNIE